MTTLVTAQGDEPRQARDRRNPIQYRDGASGSSQKHYTTNEITELWHLSPDTVRRIFESEPGVLILGSGQGAGKRRYQTLRVPEAVLERVHRRMRNPDRGGEAYGDPASHGTTKCDR